MFSELPHEQNDYFAIFHKLYELLFSCKFLQISEGEFPESFS